jgi:hypothetical protein
MTRYRQGDIVRLRKLPILSDLRVGTVHEGGSLWCTVEIAGRTFSGFVRDKDVFRVGGRP